MSIMADIRAEVGSYDTRSAEFKINGKTHVIYAKPISGADRIKLDKKNHTSFVEMIVETLVMKCADSDGKLLFTVADKPVLSQIVVGDLEKLFVDLWGTSALAEAEDDAEERAGNS